VLKPILKQRRHEKAIYIKLKTSLESLKAIIKMAIPVTQKTLN
jgi:hypothetical protein